MQALFHVAECVRGWATFLVAPIVGGQDRGHELYSAVSRQASGLGFTLEMDNMPLFFAALYSLNEEERDPIGSAPVPAWMQATDLIKLTQILELLRGVPRDVRANILRMHPQWQPNPLLIERRSFSRANAPPNRSSSRQYRKLASALTRQLPTFRYIERNALDDLTVQSKTNHLNQCVICLQPFCTKQTIKMLPCTHRYHRRCIDRWIRSSFKRMLSSPSPYCKSIACPICNIDIRSMLDP